MDGQIRGMKRWTNGGIDRQMSEKVDGQMEFESQESELIDMWIQKIDELMNRNMNR